MKKNNDRAAAGYESIRQFFSKRINIINLFAIPLIVYTVYFLYKIIISSFTNVTIPNEYREAANIELTRLFIKGINPYSLNSIQGDRPGVIYLYGPLYSLVTALLSRIIPIDIILLHYLVTFISIIAAGVLTAVLIHEYTKSITAPLAGFLFTIVCSWRYGYVNAVPDAFALMILILILFIETRKFRYRELVTSVLTIALFFTKQYFLIIFFSLVICKFIADRGSLKKYLASTALLGIATAVIVSITCPLYWTYSVYLAHGPWGITAEEYNEAFGKSESSIADTTSEAAETVQNALSASAADTDPKAGFGYEILQLRTLAGTFLFIFISAAAGMIIAFKRKTLLSMDLKMLLIIHIFVASAALIYLGRNDGAWLSYYLQLLMPAVIIYAFIIIEEIAGRADRKAELVFSMVLFAMMIFFTIYRTNSRMAVYSVSSEEEADWDRAYGILDNYCEKGEVYYYPLLEFNALKNDQYFYNNGHATVVTTWFRGEWIAVKWEPVLFPYAYRVMVKNLEYQDEIKDKIKKGEYSLVTYIEGADMSPGGERFNTGDLAEGRYEKIDTITLKAGRMSYDVQFWAKMNP